MTNFHLEKCTCLMEESFETKYPRNVYTQMFDLQYYVMSLV